MAWRMTGQMLESCSCKMLCPCTLGPAEPDQGWCSGALLFDIQQGNSDGVNLGGSKVVFAVDLPGDFLGGNGTARLYIDEAASADQRRELEAIFTGKKGGAFDALNSLITKWLPMQVVRTEIASDNTSAKGDHRSTEVAVDKDRGRQTGDAAERQHFRHRQRRVWRADARRPGGSV